VTATLPEGWEPWRTYDAWLAEAEAVEWFDAATADAGEW
jgi:hypothetical protein